MVHRCLCPAFAQRIAAVTIDLANDVCIHRFHLLSSIVFVTTAPADAPPSVPGLAVRPAQGARYGNQHSSTFDPCVYTTPTRPSAALSRGKRYITASTALQRIPAWSAFPTWNVVTSPPAPCASRARCASTASQSSTPRSPPFTSSMLKCIWVRSGEDSRASAAGTHSYVFSGTGSGMYSRRGCEPSMRMCERCRVRRRVLLERSTATEGGRQRDLVRYRERDTDSL